MQEVIKIFIFAFLVCSITSEQGCHQIPMQFENIQRINLQESYNSGTTVKVTCVTGYVGLLKLTCVNGTWSKTGGRDCKKKPCGHPGDISSGDFELTEGTEFVFGAIVTYTCRTGYVMASRVNYRVCRTQGWDNTVPICEVVRCPVIQTSEDVIAIGNTEEASYDDVVNFECASNNLMLDGPKDIHCKENGIWSDSVPKCKEIECKPPEINHGTIKGRKQIYKENDVVKYECDKDYKPRQGIPRCLRNGWSITAQCEEINCVLGPRTTGVQSTKPEGKNVFKPGEVVEITCANKYWLIGLKTKIKLIRCTENGQWETPTACEAIGCEIPYGQHVSTPWYYFGGNRNLGVDKEYWCQSGYKKAALYATCTEAGWTPNPLCIEKGCPAPTLENTKPLKNQKPKYYNGETVWYQCLPGYKPERFKITCNNNDLWDFTESCTAKQDTVLHCDSFNLRNGFTHYFPTNSSSPIQWLHYSCHQNYKPNKEGWWGQMSCRQDYLVDQPKCISSDACVGLPNIPHAKHFQTNKKIFNHGDWERFQCDYGFINIQNNIQCQNGQWKAAQGEAAQCQEMCGHPPPVENAVVLPSASSLTVTYECREPFAMTGSASIQCTQFGWEEAPTCELPSNTCGRPANEMNNATIKDTSRVKDHYLLNSQVEYKCSEGFKFQMTQTNAHCSRAGWTYPTCISSPGSNPDNEEDFQPNRESSVTVAQRELPKTGVCDPPEWIRGAVLEWNKDKYQDGERVTYECPAYYIKTGNEYLTCRNGQWIGTGQCLEPCTVDVYEMDSRKIQLKTKGREKIYAKHGDFITFTCHINFQHDGEIGLRQQCLNGKIELPLCK